MGMQNGLVFFTFTECQKHWNGVTFINPELVRKVEKLEHSPGCHVHLDGGHVIYIPRPYEAVRDELNESQPI